MRMKIFPLQPILNRGEGLRDGMNRRRQPKGRKLALNIALAWTLIVGLALACAGCGGGGSSSGAGPAAGLSGPVFLEAQASESTIYSTGDDATAISVRASTPEGYAANYEWSTTGGTLRQVSDDLYELTADEPGEYTVTIVARDRNGAATSTTVVVTSFGPGPGYGGVKGLVGIFPYEAARTARLGADTAESENILSAPVTLSGEIPLDTTRRVVFVNKGTSVTTCDRQEFVSGELILRLNSGAPAAVAADHGLTLKHTGGGGLSLLGMDVSGLSESEARQRTLDACRELNTDSRVRYADLNGIFSKQTVPNDPLLKEQWHYNMINLPQAWGITTGSPDVVVGVLDTGIVKSHLELRDRIQDGYDLIADADYSCDGDGFDADPEDVSDSRCVDADGKSDPIGTSESAHSGYHGTHTAGTIGAATNNGIGVAGIDWAARIMPVRVLGPIGGTDFWISQGLRYAAGLENDSGALPSKPARVINMSIGSPPGGGCPSTMAESFREVYEAGVTVVVSAGNNGRKDAINPAALCDHVIAVGAMRRDGELAAYSNQGPGLTIVAPGGYMEHIWMEGVLSTFRDDDADIDSGYTYYMGTSMAAPHVTGVVALMLSVNPGLTPSDIAEILSQTATDIGDEGTDETFGAGLLNAYAAVAEARRRKNAGASAGWPIVSVSDSNLHFFKEESSHSILISNTGSGSLTVTSVSDSENSGGNWMHASAVEGPGETLQLNVTVTRTGMSNGEYTGAIAINTTAGIARIQVAMQVGNPSGNQNDDCSDRTVYIMALRQSDLEPVAQTEKAGEGAYRVFAIPEGNYYIAGGTDCNNNGTICDQDIDDCGLAPIFYQPELLSVQGRRYVETNLVMIRQLGRSAKGQGVSAMSAIRRLK